MAALYLQIKPLSSPSKFESNRFSTLKPPNSLKSNHFYTLKPLNSLKSSTPTTTQTPISTLNSIKPYVQSQWQPILKAWLCSAVSVYSLSQIVPKIGTFSAVMTAANPAQLRERGLVIGLLFSVRVAASYLQQAFLWDAALGCVNEIRVDVFERVLGRELGFFEGSSGALAGDIAYRITAEASDVADTIYALLNTIVPSALQLSAMATQMVVISPVLSLVSALVIPSMALVIAYLGEKLHDISKKANISIATLSAYLNEVTAIEHKGSDKLCQTINNKINCTLWGDYADKILSYIETSVSEPLIVLLQMCKPKFFQGKASLSNALFATEIHVGDIIPEMPEFKRSFSGDISSLNVISDISSSTYMLPIEELESGSIEVKSVTDIITSEQVLPSILFVKANNAEYHESIRFQGLAHADLIARLKKKKMKALVPQVVQMIYFGTLFVICFGSLVVSSGSFDYTGVVSFITSLVLLIEPIQDVGKAYNELKQGEPAIERLFELSRSKCELMEERHAVDVESVTGEVKFCDVSFGYGDSRHLVLSGLDLHIKAGETVALVGPSGGGKTTIIKLLLRLYDPLSGQILLDNHDIQGIRVKSLRTRVGLVSQDITVFSGTVAQNIGYRDMMTEIDMKRVELAAQTANADEFIKTLPERYETNVGPRGSLLSGGQRQRLAIARALYQDPSILILDEATSALDSKSELLVRQALQRLTENRTVIVIAHRLETVLMADRIFLLNDGKLKEISRSSLMVDQHDSLSSSGLVI